jgi:hypothetical protein
MGLEQRPWILRGAILAIAALTAIVAWLGTRDDGDGATAPEPAPARIVEFDELPALVASAGHQVYWAGPKPQARLEVTAGASGNVILRYLSGDAPAGSPRGDFLTVGTYPLADPTAALDNVAGAPGAIVRYAGDGTRVVSSKRSPNSAYFAGPDNSVQVEVYDPVPGHALRLALAGGITPAPAGR